MKTNYDKYMEEVWESKEQVYQDFKKRRLCALYRFY